MQLVNERREISRRDLLQGMALRMTATIAVHSSRETSVFWRRLRCPPPSCAGVSGFTCVGFGFPGSANTNNRAIQEATIGFTQTLWGSPEHGKLQFITQSSYVVRGRWQSGVRKTPMRSSSMLISGTFSHRRRIYVYEGSAKKSHFKLRNARKLRYQNTGL